MIIRDNTKVKKGSIEFEIILKQILDLYVVTNNASASYNLYRRLILGEGYSESQHVRTTAKSFFERPDHATYIEIRKKEIYRWGFEQYAKEMSLDISNIIKKEGVSAKDIEGLSPDELRTKNLTELEEIKLDTEDNNLKVTIIKQQTDLMDAKRREKENLNSDTLIHFYLPLAKCENCPECKYLKKGEVLK